MMIFIPLLKLTIKNVKVILILMTVNPIKKIKRKIKSFFGISRNFYSCHLHSNSSFFNICSSWNINSWNSEKRDGVMYLNSVFKPVCICLQETDNSKFLSIGISPSIYRYNSVFLRANF